MKLVTGLVAVTALSVASSALAEESVASPSVRHVVALASASSSRDASVAEQPKLAEYAGRYETNTGLAFTIFREDESLTIDWPEGMHFESARLRADETGDYFVAEAAVLVAFANDRDGHVTGVTVYPPGAEAAISAAKMPARRGVVTIYDVAEASVRRGVVTIYDVPESAPTVTVAAAD